MDFMDKKQITLVLLAILDVLSALELTIINAQLVNLTLRLLLTTTTILTMAQIFVT